MCGGKHRWNTGKAVCRLRYVPSARRTPPGAQGPERDPRRGRGAGRGRAAARPADDRHDAGPRRLELPHRGTRREDDGSGHSSYAIAGVLSKSRDPEQKLNRMQVWATQASTSRHIFRSWGSPAETQPIMRAGRVRMHRSPVRTCRRYSRGRSASGRCAPGASTGCRCSSRTSTSTSRGTPSSRSRSRTPSGFLHRNLEHLIGDAGELDVGLSALLAHTIIARRNKDVPQQIQNCERMLNFRLNSTQQLNCCPAPGDVRRTLSRGTSSCGTRTRPSRRG